MKNLIISDITLKTIEDLGLNLTFREKLSVVSKLDESGVDAIELPSLNGAKENEVIYRTIASTVKQATVKIVAGSSEEVVRSTFDCVKSAEKLCLQVAMPVSTPLMEYNYHLKSGNMLQKIEELIKCARSLCENVEFVAIDAFRAEDGFVKECAKVAQLSGASSITLCDDAGEATFENYSQMVKEIKSVCQLKVFVQPSNFLSMASACTVVSIRAGVDGVKTSAVGNYLSPVVLAEILRAQKYNLNAKSNVDVTKIGAIIDVINGITKIEREENQGIDGAILVESTATLKEISNAVKNLGYELSDSDVGKVFDEFKKLTTKKEVIDVKELEAVIASTAMQVPSTYHLINYVVNSSNIIPATANITLEKNGEKFTGVSTGDGPIDASFHAIEQIIGHHYELDDFQVHAVTKGRGAVGSSIIRLRANGKLYPGNGVSTDIVGACIRAYVNALNKIVYEEN